MGESLERIHIRPRFGQGCRGGEGEAGSADRSRSAGNSVHQLRHGKQQYRNPKRAAHEQEKKTCPHHRCGTLCQYKILQIFGGAGVQDTKLPVERDGSIDLHLLAKSIRNDTAIVSVMWANNETGVLFPVEEIAAICRSHEVLFHTDAVQVAGKLKIDVQALGLDFLSLWPINSMHLKGSACFM